MAGTNGKGSTCAYMNSVLTEAGYKVGMFTSPHLVSVRERMRVNHALISEQEFIENFTKVKEFVECYNQKVKESIGNGIEEIACAKTMLAMMNKNAAIGFEAANHYYYSKGCICEKIINCFDVIRRINK